MKLPSTQSLYEEFHRLTVQKKLDYAEYRKIRKEKEKLLIAKQTVETILNIDKKKEQEQEKQSVRWQRKPRLLLRNGVVAVALFYLGLHNPVIS